MKVRITIFVGIVLGAFCLMIASDDEAMKTCQKNHSYSTCVSTLLR
jgi:hypothetical protein